MRAKTVNENIGFERNGAKKAIKVGIFRTHEFSEYMQAVRFIEKNLLVILNTDIMPDDFFKSNPSHGYDMIEDDYYNKIESYVKKFIIINDYTVSDIIKFMNDTAITIKKSGK